MPETDDRNAVRQWVEIWGLHHAEAVIDHHSHGALGLVSPPGGAGVLGVGLWLHIGLHARKRAGPTGDIELLLDCGNSVGNALEAIDAGVAGLCGSVDLTAHDRLADYAAARGIRLVPRPAPVALPPYSFEIV